MFWIHEHKYDTIAVSKVRLYMGKATSPLFPYTGKGYKEAVIELKLLEMGSISNMEESRPY